MIKTPAFRVSMYDAPFCLPCRVPLPTTCRLQAVKDWIDQAIARFEAEQKLPSADTNTGHGVDAADTEIERDLRAEIESLVDESGDFRDGPCVPRFKFALRGAFASTADQSQTDQRRYRLKAHEGCYLRAKIQVCAERCFCKHGRSIAN